MAEIRPFHLFPTFETVEDERLYRKQRLAAGFRLFAKFGYHEGAAGFADADPVELVAGSTTTLAAGLGLS